MEKPFDSKDLVERLKAQGLPAAEAVVEKVAEAVFGWTEESIAIHPNPYVKFALPVVAQVKVLALKEIDKIDGVEG